MHKRIFLVVLITIILIGQVTPNAPSRAARGTEFYAAPSAMRPGAEVVYSGFGFTPSSEVELYLQTTPSQYLGFFTTDENGNFFGSAELPVVDPGDYEVMASPNDVFTPITVLSAMTLELLPTSGPPGTVVHFTVSNLAAGQLRLDYAGAPVFGPVEVGENVYEGDFLVPADRPARLGLDAEVKAVNLQGSQVLGSAVTTFGSQERENTPYQFENVLFPPNPVAPGTTFNITGQISPPPSGPMSAFSLKVLWKSATGQIAPITVGSPYIYSDGSFSANARVPSLLAGDPLIPQPGGQIGLSLTKTGNENSSLVKNSLWGMQPPDPVFVVKVVNSSGAPIQGALVDVRAFYSDFKTLTGQTTGGQTLTNQISNLSAHPNQINDFLGTLATGEADPFSCEKTNVYGRTNAQGEFAVKFDPAIIAAMGGKIFLGYLPEPTYMDAPTEVTFPLYVNALHKGYGAMEGTLPVPYTRNIRFSSTTNHFFDAATNQLLVTNPLVVTLPSLPASANVTIPIVPKVSGGGTVVGGFKNYLGTGIPITAFGKFYSFPIAQFPDAWFTFDSSKEIRIEFQHDQALFGALDEANLKFTLLGNTYYFQNKGEKFTGTVGCSAILYRATILNAHRLPVGNHTGLIEIRDKSVPPKVTKYYIQLNFAPAPTWVLDSKYKQRSIRIDSWNGVVRIIGNQFPPGGPDSSSNLPTNIPKVGNMNNQVSFQDGVFQYLYPDKTSAIQFESQLDTTALNETANPQQFTQNVGGGTELLIGPDSQTILDTGKIPLFRDVFGIWPIASATIGADMWFDATLTYEGKVKFLTTGGAQTSLIVTPEATVGVDAFFDLSAIFGVVSANAHAIPQIKLKMPAEFLDGKLNDSKKCFLYKLDIKWSAKAGVCPFCVKDSGTKNIFNGSNPDPCTLVASSAARVSATAVTTPPPTSSPALAVDGFGHTFLLWTDENGNIQSQLLSGGQVVASLPVTSSGASAAPQVAFFAPNRAIAVWAESSLTASQSQTATLNQIVQSQHLKYALWNGATWGAAQNLTLPADSNGEGGVALAGCMSTKTGCPVDGAVSAVWVRDAHPSGDLAARQFRLFYATFTNSSWSAPQAVDSASTATDSEASLAYLSSGTPLVVWVRDADRDLGTTQDRQIAYRTLSAGQPVLIDASLPAGAVEPSLALNSQDELHLAFTVATDPQALIGNQRQLHVAKRTCASGCTWAVQALVDANARLVHAESPVITLNGSGQVQVTYRALGFGPESPGSEVVLPGDPLGVILGTGELAQAFVSFSSNTIAPTYLTNAGKTVWQTTAVFDPLLNQVYAAGSQGSGPALPLQAVNLLSAQGYPVANLDASADPLVFSTTGALPDFAIFDASTSTAYPQDELGPFEVQMTLVNNGPDLNQPLQVQLSWDAPAGLGLSAGEFELGTFSAGSLGVIEFDVNPPANPHLPHTLYVQVNPTQTISESTYENNQRTLAIGGLPVPQGVLAAAQPGDSSVFLEWQPVDTSLAVGYRVFRTSDGRTWQPVGSSFGPYFVDLSAIPGQSYQYAVAAYAGDGSESPLSQPALVEVGEAGELPTVYLPLVIR